MTIIPTPPTHCSILRQINIPCGKFSTLLNMVEPVVVIPDIDSKIEFVRLKLESEKKKGKAPKTLIKIQDKVVIRKAS